MPWLNFYWFSFKFMNNLGDLLSVLGSFFNSHQNYLFFLWSFSKCILNILFLAVLIFFYPFVALENEIEGKNKSFSVKLPDTCIILHIKSQLTLTKGWLSTAPCLLCAYTCLCSGFMLSENAQSSLLELFQTHKQSFPVGFLMLPGSSAISSVLALCLPPAQLLIPTVLNETLWFFFPILLFISTYLEKMKNSEETTHHLTIYHTACGPHTSSVLTPLMHCAVPFWLSRSSSLQYLNSLLLTYSWEYSSIIVLPLSCFINFLPLDHCQQQNNTVHLLMNMNQTRKQTFFLLHTPSPAITVFSQGTVYFIVSSFQFGFSSIL